MLRSLAEVFALFALPFIVYFLVVIIRGRPLDALAQDHRRQAPKLILAGLITAFIGILLLGFLEERKQGSYVPAQFRDGKLIPGELK